MLFVIKQSVAFHPTSKIYCSTPCSIAGQVEAKLGSKIKTKSGYILVKTHSPQSNNKGYEFEHRLVMQQHLGRILDRSELVHHLNKIKDDNRIENLALVSQFEHNTIHSNEPTNHFKMHAKDVRKQQSILRRRMWRLQVGIIPTRRSSESKRIKQ